MRGQTPPRSRPPSAAGSYSPTTSLDGTHLLANHSVAGGGWRTALALVIMPHSGRDRHLISLHPPLCRYSRRGAGLWNSVRTCLTPPATVPPTPCTFPLCRTFKGHGRRPSNTVWLLTRARLGRWHPRRLTSSDVGFCALLQPSPRRLTGATGQGCAPGMGGRICKDDGHDLRHAPQRSATGMTNYSPPDHGGRSRRPH